MYNFKLIDGEEIEVICDDVLVGPDDKKCTVIITNKRFLVLDYPGMINNSAEELRILGRMNTVRMKEIIFETNIYNIKRVVKDGEYHKYVLDDDTYVLLNNDDIRKYMDKLLEK